MAWLRDADDGAPVEDALMMDRQCARRAATEYCIAVLVPLVFLPRWHAAVVRTRNHFCRPGLCWRVLREVKYLEEIELRTEQTVRVLVPACCSLHRRSAEGLEVTQVTSQPLPG